LRFSPVTVEIEAQVEALRPLVERVRQELQ